MTTATTETTMAKTCPACGAEHTRKRWETCSTDCTAELKRRAAAPEVTARVPDLEVHTPPVVSQVQPVETVDVVTDSFTLRFWPGDVAMPRTYKRRRPLPCPYCRRVRFDNGRQAVKVASGGPGGACVYLECMACNKRWSAPVVEV